jgi:hypothetical protein
MVRDAETPIHERLDELVAAVGEIKTDLAVAITACQDCRPIVMGNGGDSIDKRVDRMEEWRGRTMTRTMMRIAFLSAAIASLIAVIAGAIVRAIGG